MQGEQKPLEKMEIVVYGFQKGLPWKGFIFQCCFFRLLKVFKPQIAQMLYGLFAGEV